MNTNKPTLTPNDVPEVSPKLINWLANLYPNRLPSQLEGFHEKLPRLVGQQDVIGRLRQEMERQSG